MQDRTLSHAKFVKVLIALVACWFVLANGPFAFAEGWTIERAAELIPPVGATGYWVHGQWVSCPVKEEVQNSLIWSIAVETGVDKAALKGAVAKRNVLYKQGKIAWYSPDGSGMPADVIVLAQGTGSSQSSSGSSGNSTGTGAGAGAAAGGAAGGAAGTEGNAEDANPGTSFEVRQNYFKRFPYAKSAFSNDVKRKVGGNESGKALGGSDARKGSKKKQQGPLNLQESVGPGFGSVMAYRYVIKFCDDNPKKGICYFQPLLIANDKPKTMRDNELFRTAMQGVNGLPLTDTQFQILDRENKQRFLELLFDPERFMWLAVNTGQMQGASLANSFAGAGQSTFNNAFLTIVGGTDNLGGSAQASSDAGGSIGALFSKNGPLGAVMGTSGGAGKSGGSSGGGGGGAFSGGHSDVLINVANESAAVAVSPGTRDKSVQQAVWMVQQAYKYIFVPMSILFLLPGAVLTQVKGYVARGILGGGDQDASSPFEGILRAMIAVFLIPATQLIISYAVDVGNSMAESVKPWINKNAMDEYVYHQLYDVPVGNVTNALLGPGSGQTTVEGKALTRGGALAGGRGTGGGAYPGGGSSTGGSTSSGGGFTSGFSSGLSDFQGFLSSISPYANFIPGLGGIIAGFQSGAALTQQAIDGFSQAYDSIIQQFGNSIFGVEGQGKGAEIPPDRTIQEKQLWLSQIMQLMFNGLNYIMSYALIVLCAYQLVMMCYLFLLGPISACFFAWPGVGRSLFRSVFSQWLNAVIVLSLWRFYWCVILAVMTQRIIWIMDTGGFKQDIQWEMMVFCCFLGMMLVIPFQPFSFDPGALASKVIEKGSQAGSDIGKAAGAVTKGTPLEGAGKELQANMGQVTQQMGYVAQGVSGRSGEGGGVGLLGDSSGLLKTGEEGKKYEQGRQQALQPLPPSTGHAAGGTSPGAGTLAPPSAGAPPSAPSPPSSASASNPTVSAIQQQAGTQAVQTLPTGHPPTVPLSPAASAGVAGVSAGAAAGTGLSAGASSGGYRLVVANASVPPSVGAAATQAMTQLAKSSGLTPAAPPAPPSAGGSPPSTGGPPAPSGPAPSGTPPASGGPSSPGPSSSGGSPGVGPPPPSRPV